MLAATLFFNTAGIANWRFLPVLVAAIPLVNALFFSLCPIVAPEGDADPVSYKTIFGMKFFFVFLMLMAASGAADALTVQLTRSAIATAVPVVGSILSDATGAVLAGAGMLKSAVGVFGLLAVLAICLTPFVTMAVQYLLYKLAAFLAGAVGPPELRDLIDGLAGAFGLVLGMTGACALLLLVSVLSSVAAVTP